MLFFRFVSFSSLFVGWHRIEIEHSFKQKVEGDQFDSGI